MEPTPPAARFFCSNMAATIAKQPSAKMMLNTINNGDMPEHSISYINAGGVYHSFLCMAMFMPPWIWGIFNVNACARALTG
jgi:hypothetical protein